MLPKFLIGFNYFYTFANPVSKCFSQSSGGGTPFPAVIPRSVSDEESLPQLPPLPACIPNCRFLTTFGMTREEGGSEWQGKRAVRNDRGGGDSELAGKGWRNDRGGAVRNDGLLKDPGFVRLFSVIPTHAPALVAARGRS